MKTSIGRIVRYRVAPYDLIGQARADQVGTERAAMIVNDWGGQEDTDSHPNLLVFPDGGNDGQTPPVPVWMTSVPFQPTANGSWFWPPRESAAAPVAAPTPAPDASPAS